MRSRTVCQQSVPVDGAPYLIYLKVGFFRLLCYFPLRYPILPTSATLSRSSIVLIISFSGCFGHNSDPTRYHNSCLKGLSQSRFDIHSSLRNQAPPSRFAYILTEPSYGSVSGSTAIGVWCSTLTRRSRVSDKGTPNLILHYR